MKASPQERETRRAAFRRLSPGGKLEYIFMYYRLPLALGLIALIIVVAAVYRGATKKEPVLYLGLTNVAVGDALHDRLTAGYIRAAELDAGRREVYAYDALYLSADPAAQNHEYAYASRLKVLAAVNAQELDAVLMNREAYDFLSRSGYLLDLGPVLSGRAELAPYLRENAVVLEDNAIDLTLNKADAYEAVTETVRNAVEVSALPLLRQAGFADSVYFGVLANTPRLDAVLAYLNYLAAGA